MKKRIIERVSLARDGFMSNAVDKVATGYRPAFDCVLLPIPRIRHTQWDHGDVTSRALSAWSQTRHITGDQNVGREVEEGLWSHLRSIIHPETGMVFVPEHSDSVNGHYYYHLWDQGRLFDHLAWRYSSGHYPTEERPLILAMMHRLQDGLLRLAKWRKLPDGHEAVYWEYDAFWDDSPQLPSDRDFGDQNWTGWCIATSQIVGPQANLLRATGDTRDHELAMAIARGFLAGLESPRRGSTAPMFAPGGEFRGHFHGAISGIDGVLNLARWLWDHGDRHQAEEWIELAIQVYRWIFDPSRNVNPGAACGYFPETAADRPHTVSELCCCADMIEFASHLASCAPLKPEWAWLSDLWDDVERFTRNEIFKMQFTQTDVLRPHLLLSKGLTLDEAESCLDRLRGTWGSCRSFLHDLAQYGNMDFITSAFPHLAAHPDLTQSTPLLTSGGCCAYSGVRALHTAWKEAMHCEPHRTEARIVSDHEDENVQITPGSGGGFSFLAKQDCSLRIRIPLRVNPDELRFANGDGIGEWSEDRRWLTVPLASGQSGEIQWTEPEWEARETVGPTNSHGIIPGLACGQRLECACHYRGNQLTNITPAALKLSYLYGL